MKAALCGVLILAGCAHKSVVGPKIDPALATLIPEDTTLLVGTRLEALEKTPVYQKYLFAGGGVRETDGARSEKGFVGAAVCFERQK
jgi:hypothetical protein